MDPRLGIEPHVLFHLQQGSHCITIIVMDQKLPFPFDFYVKFFV